MCPHNGALSGKRCPVFDRSLSRTAPGEWLENLCSFTPGSVPLRPATGDYTFSDAYVIVNSAKSSTRSRGRFFLRNGQSRACPSALYRRKGEKSTSIFAFPPHFPPAEAAKRRCVRLRGIRRAAAFSLVLNQPSVNHFELLRAAYRGIPCQAVLKPL